MRTRPAGTTELLQTQSHIHIHKKWLLVSGEAPDHRTYTPRARAYSIYVQIDLLPLHVFPVSLGTSRYCLYPQLTPDTSATRPEWRRRCPAEADPAEWQTLPAPTNTSSLFFLLNNCSGSAAVARAQLPHELARDPAPLKLRRCLHPGAVCWDSLWRCESNNRGLFSSAISRAAYLN